MLRNTLNGNGIADSSTPGGCFVNWMVLQDKPTGTLAGKMATVVDLVTRLYIWFERNPGRATPFEADLLTVLTAQQWLWTKRFYLPVLSATDCNQTAFHLPLESRSLPTQWNGFSPRHPQIETIWSKFRVKRKKCHNYAFEATGSLWLNLVQLPDFITRPNNCHRL